MLEPTQCLGTLAYLKRTAFDSAIKMAMAQCEENINEAGDSDEVDEKLIKDSFRKHLAELEGIGQDTIICELPKKILDDINEQLFLLLMAHDELMKDILKIRNAARLQK